MITVSRAADRYRVDHGGITTWSVFSSGANYDPANVSFGPVVACDKHLLAPGAGFDVHSHRGVELISWVIAGTLTHSDGEGRTRQVGPGLVQHQVAGDGIRHTERNASAAEPLRFVQLWLVCDADASDYTLAAPPLTLHEGTFRVVRSVVDVDGSPLFGFVAAGEFTIGATVLQAGDSVQASDEPLRVHGTGELLIVTFRC